MTLAFVQNIGGETILLFFLAYFAFWVYCLVDIIRSDFRDPNMKLIRILVLILGQGIGPFIYLILGKNSKTTLSHVETSRTCCLCLHHL